MNDSADRLEVNEYLKEYETVISDWKSAVQLINQVIDGNWVHGHREIVWRGLTNSNYWPDHSLYRLLQRRNSRLSGSEASRPPFEADLRKYEVGLLNQARSEWRFDHLSALEIFARIRHFGGPTRLLDVTYNPLIALWFAVEKQFDETGREKPQIDGRLFAFDVTEGKILLDNEWSGRELPWDSESFVNLRGVNGGERHWIWKPPSYNERIPAQNSAFLIGRVPAEVELLWKYYTDTDFQAKLESVPSLISNTQATISALSDTSEMLSIDQKFARDFKLLNMIIGDLRTLGEIGTEVDRLTLASLDIVERITGGKFRPRLLNMREEIAWLEGMTIDVSGESGQVGALDLEELLKSGTQEEFHQFDRDILTSCEETSENLVMFDEAVRGIRDWIVSVVHPITGASIAMDMRRPADKTQPTASSSYTIRILAEAKIEIREILKSSYGYSASTIYPDIMGLAEKGENQVE